MTFDKTKAMRNAEKFLSQGKLRSAISEYEQVVKFDPTDFGTINTLGDLYSKNADVRKAVKCYAAVADHYARQGFAQKAIAVYNKISKLEPNSVEVWKKLAELYKQKGSMSEARAKYQRVADHYEQAGQKIEALSIRKEIAELDPTDAQSFLSLADSYLAEKQFDDALAAYQEAGTRLEKKGAHAEAIAAYERALSIQKNMPAVLGGLVRALSVLGRARESVDRLSELLNEFPHSRELRILLIDSLIETDEIAEAEKAVVRLVEMEPANYPKFLELARIYLDRTDAVSATRILSMSAEHMLVGGQAEEFSALVNSVLAQDPEQLDALRLQARYCSWQRDEDALCTSLAKLAEVARAAEVVEDERFALLQLTMLIPQDAGYAERLAEINAAYGFDGTEPDENLFDKRFFKAEAAVTSGVVSGQDSGSTAPSSDVIGDTGFEFIGHVAEVVEPAHEVAPYAAATDSSRLQKEIDSIRFYIENGYLELAEKATNELRAEFGECAEIVELIGEMRTLNALASGEDTASSLAHPTGDPAKECVRGEFDPQNLAAEFGLEEQIPSEVSDYETHYNTGIAYQEMGLIEEAIKELQAAASLAGANDGTRRFFASANLLGHCFMQQGMPHLARKWFERSLEADDLTKEEKQGVWYELASACEADGDLEHAGRFFEQVYAENVDFRDVSQRIRTFAVNH